MACEFCEQFIGEGVSEQMAGYMGAGVLAALVAVGVLIAILAFAALYVYTALAWRTIARKSKYKRDWLAWIPIASNAMVLQIGGFHWAWIFLLLIPVAGWIALMILSIIAMWRIFEKLKHPGWFSLAPIVPKVGGILYLIAIGIVAWSEKK